MTQEGLDRQSHDRSGTPSAAFRGSVSLRPATATSTRAIASVLVGALSFLLLPLNVIAIGLGLSAKRRIRSSAGHLGGEAFATAGLLLGGASLTLTVGTGLLVLVRLIAPASLDSLAPPIASPAALVVNPHGSGAEPSPADGEELADGHINLREQQIGTLVIVDIDANVVSLDSAINEQRLQATAESQRLLLWLVSPKCLDCGPIEKALPHPAMQDALKGTRILRLNVQDFHSELTEMRIPTDSVPGFALLNASNTPTDYLYPGEWDEDIPTLMAPVLESFMEGSLTQRKQLWRGGKRDGETAI